MEALWHDDLFADFRETSVGRMRVLHGCAAEELAANVLREKLGAHVSRNTYAMEGCVPDLLAVCPDRQFYVEVKSVAFGAELLIRWTQHFAMGEFNIPAKYVLVIHPPGTMKRAGGRPSRLYGILAKTSTIALVEHDQMADLIGKHGKAVHRVAEAKVGFQSYDWWKIPVGRILKALPEGAFLTKGGTDE